MDKLQVVQAWIQQNYSTVIALSGTLWTLLSIVNGMVKNPEAKSILGKIMDALSYIKRADAVGSVKAPFKMSQPKDAASDKPPGASGVVPPATVLLALAFLGLCACAAVKGALIDFGQCELGQVPSAVAGIAPDVEKVLGSESPNWENDLKAIGLKAGEDAVQCAIAAMLHNLSKIHGEMAPPARRKLERGQLYLAAHRLRADGGGVK